MEAFFFIVIILFGLFVFVILRGAPYLPTLNKQVEDALDLLDLKPGQVLLELGSGDGRVLRAAAERGIYSIGFELNPILVVYTRIKHWRYRKFISVKWTDYWLEEWPKSDAMYVFLLQKYMKKLDKKVAHYVKSEPYLLASFAFEIPGKKPFKQKNGISIYKYN